MVKYGHNYGQVFFFPVLEVFLLYSALLTKSLVSAVLISLTCLTNSPYSAFLTTSFFAASLSLLKSTGTCTNSSTPNLSKLLFKLVKQLDTFSSLS